MQNFAILFLAVEKSSDIELLFLYMNRDCLTDIRMSGLATMSKAGRCLQDKNFIAGDVKLLFLKRTDLSSSTTVLLCCRHFSCFQRVYFV